MALLRPKMTAWSVALTGGIVGIVLNPSLALAASPGVTVLINSAHGANQLVQAFQILEPGVTIGTQAIIDRTVCSAGDATFDPTFVTDSINTGLSFYSVVNGACGPPVTGEENFAPYQILNQSFSNPPMESTNYAQLEAQGQVLSTPYLGACLQNVACAQPGIYTVETSSFFPGVPASASGAEFMFSNDYKGFTTDAASWATASMGGVYAALRYNHPTWTIPDITGALRQTAANWTTGYSASAYGYGIVNYDAANAISSPTSLFLQPPTLAVDSHGYYATLTLYPFRQSRRAHEVIYSEPSGYAWPVKNEYTTADLTAAGGTLLYTSNGTDVTPTFTYVPGASGSITFVAFTTDGLGNYSRVESFSPIAESFLVGTACLQ